MEIVVRLDQLQLSTALSCVSFKGANKMAPCDDKASQSNPEEVAATHVSLLMDVDFNTQVIQATAQYEAEVMVS